MKRVMVMAMLLAAACSQEPELTEVAEPAVVPTPIKVELPVIAVSVARPVTEEPERERVVPKRAVVTELPKLPEGWNLLKEERRGAGWRVLAMKGSRVADLLISAPRAGESQDEWRSRIETELSEHARESVAYFADRE